MTKSIEELTDEEIWNICNKHKLCYDSGGCCLQDKELHQCMITFGRKNEYAKVKIEID
jgi:hypothetical protein